MHALQHANGLYQPRVGGVVVHEIENVCEDAQNACKLVKAVNEPREDGADAGQDLDAVVEALFR